MPGPSRTRPLGGRQLTSRAERLRFVIDLAQADLHALRPEESMAIQRGLADTLWFGISPEPKRIRGDIHRQARVAGDWKQRTAAGREESLRPEPAIYAMPNKELLSFDELCQLQEDLRRLLDAVAVDPERQLQDSRALVMPWVSLRDVQTCVTGTDLYNPAVHRTTWYIRGAPRDVLLFMVQLMLVVETTACIQRCPECTRLFYRAGKQKYCSPRCTNAVALRHYRSDPDKKQAEADRAHQRYAERITQAGTRKIIIKRRPRGRESSHTTEERHDVETPRE